MSAKMRRRRRQARARRIRALRRDLGLFYAHGICPPQACVFASCWCGSSAFSLDPADRLDDWREQHAYCEAYADAP